MPETAVPTRLERARNFLADTRVQLGIAGGVLASAAALMAGAAGAKTPRIEAGTLGGEAKVTAIATTEPGVQAFEVVASNDPLQTPSPELITSLHSVQTYFNKNGNGLRVNFRENSNGSYNLPILRINMTQDQLRTAAEEKVYKAVQDALPDDSGNNTLNLGLVKGANFKISCMALGGSIANPERLSIVSLQDNCNSPDSNPGFDARGVQMAMAIIWAGKFSEFSYDPQDTMSLRKVAWNLSWINHSRKYDQIFSSQFFQRHIPYESIGPGNVGAVPPPDSCKEDCGTTPLFTQGQLVTITAQPGANGEFKSWQNCPNPEGNVCKVDLSTIANDPMEPIKPITAKFVDKSPPPPFSSKLKVDYVSGPGEIIYQGKRYKNDFEVASKKKGEVKTVAFDPNTVDDYVVVLSGCTKREDKRNPYPAVGSKGQTIICREKMDSNTEPAIRVKFVHKPIKKFTGQP